MCAGTTRRHERARSAVDYNVLDESPDSPIGYARRPSRLLFVFIELGAAIVGLALLARLANRWGFSATPLYLVVWLSAMAGSRPSI